MRARSLLTALVALTTVVALSGCGTADDTTMTAPGSSAPPGTTPPGTATGPGVVDPSSSTTTQPDGLPTITDAMERWEVLLAAALPAVTSPGGTVTWDRELLHRCGPRDEVLDGLTLTGRFQLVGDADDPASDLSLVVDAVEGSGARVERAEDRIWASDDDWTIRFDQALIQIYPPEWSVEIRATVAEEPIPNGFEMGRTFCG